MFTPAELEMIPIQIVKLFNQLETDLMTEIVERIAAIDEISRTADYEIIQLARLGLSSEQIKKRIQSALNLSKEEIDHIYGDIVKEGYAGNEKLYTAEGTELIPFEDNVELQQLIQAIEVQTIQELENITQSMGFAVKMGDKTVFTPIGEYYQSILDKSMMQLMTGAFDYNKVIKQTVKEMTNSGIRSVEYASGHSNRTAVAARRALMTGFSQVVGKIVETHMDELETDIVEVSAHTGARNKGVGPVNHQEWQGKCYRWNRGNKVSYDIDKYKFPDFIEVTGYSVNPLGLCGFNCRHSYNAFVPGASTRSYTDQELEDIKRAENTTKSYKGKEYTTYEATQRQRKLETIMRAKREEVRLLERGNANAENVMNAKCRYRATMAEYVDFSKTMKLPQQRERIYVDGIGRL